MRVIIKYQRSGSAKYLSHLDMQRFFARAFRRSELPVAYSLGFNPHIIMSFASPLSVGYGTLGDYLEVKLIEELPPEKIMLALLSVMPDNIKVVFAGRLRDDEKKLMSLNSVAEYEIVFEHDIEDEWKDFSEKETVKTEDRKGRIVDLKQFVVSGKANGRNLDVLLKNSSEHSLNPAAIAKLFSQDGEKIIFTRIECFCNTGDGDKPFYELVENPN